MTARPIAPDELLALAASLAPLEAGPGRPRTVALRRAVSTAYYALFHELIEQATRELIGPDSVDEPSRRQAARWFAHADIKQMAEVATRAGNGQSALAVALGPPGPELQRIADAFVALQAARHRADYDHDYDLKRRDAVLLVETARDAVAQIRRLEKAGDASLRRFLKLMVGAVRIAKNRGG